MYGYLSSLRRGLLTPPIITVHCLYLILQRKHGSMNTRENAWVYPESTGPACHALWSLKSASSIYQQLKLTLTPISAAPGQAARLPASITKQIMLPSHSPPA
jgi:hypothetical protein